MAENRSATTVDAAKALIGLPDELVDPEVRRELRRIVTSAYRSSADLDLLKERLWPYSGSLTGLGFSYDKLISPEPGPADGAFQLEIPGQYKVHTLQDVSAGMVDAGNGRKFLVVSWGGLCPGTMVLRQSDTPKCFVEVAQSFERKELEAAVTGVLLGGVDPGTPFDELRKRLATSEKRVMRQGQQSAKTAIKASMKRGRGNAGRNP